MWSSENGIDGQESRNKSWRRGGEQVGVEFGVLKPPFQCRVVEPFELQEVPTRALESRSSWTLLPVHLLQSTVPCEFCWCG